MRNLLNIFWVYGNVTDLEQEDGISFFYLRELSKSEIIFFVGVLIITLVTLAFLVLWYLRKRKDFFKNTDIPEETISLHIKSEEEQEKEAKYEKEVEKIIRHRRYSKRRKK